MFCFSLPLLSQTLIILDRTERDMITNVIALHVKLFQFFLSHFDESSILSTDLKKKSSKIKFNDNLTSGTRGVPRGPTDMREKSRFSKLCERA